MRVGVATVNWNRPSDTLACLESLRRATPGPVHVVVADNASTDDSVATIRAWAAEHRDFPLTVLALDDNRGYAAGGNRAITVLARDPAVTHFLLFNNDATVDPTFFAAVESGLRHADDVAVLGPTIYHGPTRDHVWYAGGRLPRWRALAEHGTTLPSGDDLRATEFVCGAAMLISRTAWEQLGPLPECYFIYFEDTEYSHRALAAGLRVAYLPGAVVHHESGTTMGTTPNPRNEYRFSRSRALYVQRNLRGLSRWSAIGYLILSRPLRAALDLARGRPAVARAGLVGTLRGLLAVERDGKAGEASAVQRRRDRVVVDE